MEKKVLLQVIDEGDGLHFHFEGAREQVFEVIGAMIEALHYGDIMRGICVKDSMGDIGHRILKVKIKAFGNAHERCEREVNSNNGN